MWYALLVHVLYLASCIIIPMEEWVRKMMQMWWPPAPLLNVMCCVDHEYHYRENAILPRNDVLDCVVFAQHDADFIAVYRNNLNQPPRRIASTLRFLAVTYHHPDVGSVALALAQEMMLVGNEILSPAFVRRFIHRALPFDDRYWIECITDRIQFFKFGAKEHLVITEDGCTIADL